MNAAYACPGDAQVGEHDTVAAVAGLATVEVDLQGRPSDSLDAPLAVAAAHDHGDPLHQCMPLSDLCRMPGADEKNRA